MTATLETVGKALWSVWFAASVMSDFETRVENVEDADLLFADYYNSASTLTAAVDALLDEINRLHPSLRAGLALGFNDEDIAATERGSRYAGAAERRYALRVVGADEGGAA